MRLIDLGGVSVDATAVVGVQTYIGQDLTVEGRPVRSLVILRNMTDRGAFSTLTRAEVADAVHAEIARRDASILPTMS